MINDSLSSSYPSSSSSSTSLLFFFFFYWQGPKVKTTARSSHLLSFAFKFYHSRLAAVVWSTSVRTKAHLISLLSFLAQINPTTLWLKSSFLWHKCVLDGPMLYLTVASLAFSRLHCCQYLETLLFPDVPYASIPQTSASTNWTWNSHYEYGDLHIEPPPSCRNQDNL